MKRKIDFIIEDLNGKSDIKPVINDFIDITSWKLTYRGAPITKIQASLYEKLCLALFGNVEKILIEEKLDDLKAYLVWEIFGQATITDYRASKIVFQTDKFKIILTYQGNDEHDEYWMEDGNVQE
jgi:hypothetical protein